MKVNFRGLDVAYFDILEIDGKRYLLDSHSTTSKHYHWGFAPATFEMDVIELEESNRNFNKRIKASSSGSAWKWGSIAMGTFLAQYSASIFRYFDLSHKPALKLFLFALSIVFAAAIYFMILSRSRKEIARRLPLTYQKEKLIFKNRKTKRQFHSYLFVLVHCMIFFLYMDTGDGNEGGLLFINGIVVYLFIWMESGVIPLSYAYQKQYVEFDRIEKSS